ncbi:MAG: GNAT family N-acetyltransferase [Shimia sp.]
MRYAVLGADDAAAWRAVRLDGLARFPTAFLTTHAEQAARPLDDTAAALARGFSRGVWEGDDLVAIGALLPVAKAACAHRAEVGAFYALPRVWGRGAADVLMAGIVADADAAGRWQLELFVAETNPRAVRFYERHGFRRRGVLPNATLTGDTYTTDLFMTRDARTV